ncbi:MAG: hypothetical protein Q9190_000159 [Brigantiaea leucoxantha]
MANDDDYTLYAYSPNKAPPILFAVLFSISTGFHIYQNFRYKSWLVTGALPWGGSLFIAGFIMREISAYNPHNLEVFIASLTLLYLAPPVYALTNYITLGRTLYYIPYLSPIHPGRVISTFIGLDAVIGAVTGNGAARVSNKSNTSEQIATGEALLKASILLQVISFLGFILLEVVFHRRCIEASILPPNVKADNVEAHKQSQRLQNVLNVMYVSGAIISCRHIYRAVETFQGYTGYLGSHEWPFYVFDGAFMAISAFIWNIWHPMRFLPRNNKIYLSKDGVTELLGPGWVDKRPFLITLVDPFDIMGFFLKRDKEKFWEREEQHTRVVKEESSQSSKELV